MLWAAPASAQSCTGRFVNPISDVCWECLFPISIGPIAIGSVSGVLDTPNPSSPICLCGSPIPRIGLSLGVWEPARLVDATRAPWCFPNLGGLTIDPGLPAGRGRTGAAGGDGAKGSVWHAHYYMYPLLSWIGVLLDLGCLEGGGLDIAWASELDPAWLDDELSFLLNPEAALFANLPAQAACAADCAASSAGLPLDPMFWCAGLPGRDVSADRQRRGPCRRGPGLAARGPAPGLPSPPRRDRLGHLGPGGALRALPDADHAEVAIPLADDRAGAGDLAHDRLQPHGALLGAVGDAARAAGCGRELRLPAVAESDRAASCEPDDSTGQIRVPERHDDGRSPVPNRRFHPRRGAGGGLVRCGSRRGGSRPEARDAIRPGWSRRCCARRAETARMRSARGSRSILDRALERAGEAGRQTVLDSSGRSTAPLPAERHAGGFIEGAAGRGGTAEILIFTSLSVPPASWRQWAREAARSGAPLVLRGVGAGGLPETAKRIGERLGGAQAGVAIDPRLFRLFGVDRVPAVIVVPGGVPPCRSRGCAQDPAPPHDLVTGNIGLVAALEAVADEGAVGGDAARRHLQRLRGDARP